MRADGKVTLLSQGKRHFIEVIGLELPPSIFLFGVGKSTLEIRLDGVTLFNIGEWTIDPVGDGPSRLINIVARSDFGEGRGSAKMTQRLTEMVYSTWDDDLRALKHLKQSVVCNELHLKYMTQAFMIAESTAHAVNARQIALDAQEYADNLDAKASLAESVAAKQLADEVYASRILHSRRKS